MITFLISLEDGDFVVRAEGFSDMRFSVFNDLVKELPKQLSRQLLDESDFEVLWEYDDD